MIIEYCIRCGSKIELEVDDNTKYYNCPKCQVMVPNAYLTKSPEEVKQMVLGKDKKPKKERKSGLTLKCGACGALKKAGKRRYERWKGKPYLCRECRKKKREAEKAEKAKKKVEKKK